jgi:hypothetical protein
LATLAWLTERVLLQAEALHWASAFIFCGFVQPSRRATGFSVAHTVSKGETLQTLMPSSRLVRYPIFSTADAVPQLTVNFSQDPQGKTSPRDNPF